jgi:hypothetical protein
VAGKLSKAALKKQMGGRLPTGPHALSLTGERNEKPGTEAKESKAFESAERKLGIEGRYNSKRPKKKSRGK